MLKACRSVIGTRSTGFPPGFLIQALLAYVVLQAVYLLTGFFDSLSEGVIIPFSGVSKSGAVAIIQAGGAGGFTR
ncbi:hypothetical protein LN032_04005 [Klebsiella pneumoniae]|nr:hypothetical protein [Klebsiella pneumoniae]